MLRHKAVSLVELLIIIGIISILVAIILVAVNIVKKKGAEARVQSDVSQVKALAESYFNVNGTYNGLQCSPTSTSACESWANITTTDKASDIKKKIGELAQDIKTQINSANTNLGLYLRFRPITGTGMGNTGAMMMVPKLSTLDQNTGNSVWLCLDTAGQTIKEFTSWTAAEPAWTNASCQ